MIFLILFFIFFILEGLALLPSKINLLTFSLLPIFYFLEKNLKKEKIVLPSLNLFYLFVIFLFLLPINFYFSVDKIQTLDKIIWYLTVFFFFIIAKNEKKTLTNLVPFFFVLSGLIFSVFSLFASKMNITTAYQFIYPSYPNHNHLGDFLGLSILSLILFKFNNKLKIGLLVLFLSFFLFSFSRSAYLDLFIILLALLFQKKIKLIINRKIFFLILFLIVLFFIISQNKFYQISFFKPFYSLVIQDLKLIPRDLLSNRLNYFFQGVEGVIDKPITGWGLGNYIYPSKKYTFFSLDEVKSALNWPLTLLVETGLLSFPFFIFLLLIFKNLLKEKNHYFFLILYQFLNFQTDYTFSILGFFLLFFLLLPLGLKIEKSKVINPKYYFSIIFIFTIFLWLYLTGKIFALIGLHNLAKFFNPYQHEVWQNLIKKELN